MVAGPNRVRAKRRSCEHEISWLESLAETAEVAAKPLKGLKLADEHDEFSWSRLSGELERL
jgi:hypothetical protein